MKIGFVSAILPDLTLEQVLAFAAAEKFDCVDIFHVKSAHHRNRFFFEKELVGSFCPELVARSLEICPNHLASFPKSANDR